MSFITEVLSEMYVYVVQLALSVLQISLLTVVLVVAKAVLLVVAEVVVVLLVNAVVIQRMRLPT